MSSTAIDFWLPIIGVCVSLHTCRECGPELAGVAARISSDIQSKNFVGPPEPEKPEKDSCANEPHP